MFEVMTASDLDAAALGRFLADAGLAAAEDLRVERINGGSQNELYELRSGYTRLALRMPPAHANADRLRTMDREFTVLEALGRTDVPHPRLRGGDRSGTVLGRPFLVMDLIDGWSPASGGFPAPFDDIATRQGLAFELAKGAALLARVDWRGIGLADFGRPNGFHERQVDRWLAFLDQVRFRDLPGLDEAAGWLRANQPKHWEPGILHGDYQFANVMFRHHAPAELAAVIDWEMTTIGDPLLDLGWALLAWPPEGDGMEYRKAFDLDGMPARDRIVEHYAAVSGRDVTDFDYYVVLARWKLGIVLEKTASRLHQTDPRLNDVGLGAMVPDLISKAAELAATRT
jgi:aminoglycoside phosphotransferase (APT) family kinase protein